MQKESCDSFDGIPHYRKFSSKPVCCNKKCPRCGGKGCNKLTDSDGKKLGRRQCCGMNILNQGKICGQQQENAGNAPCKVALKGNDVVDNFYDQIMMMLMFQQ